MSQHEWPFRLATPGDYQSQQFQVDLGLALQAAELQGGGSYCKFLDQIVRWIANTRNLKMAWDHLERSGGQTAGPDGSTYSKISRNQCWEKLRELSHKILAGKYHHGPVREVRHPKRSGRGFRTIHVSDILDRVVARAATQILSPLLDPGLGDLMFCRPSRGPWHAMAHARALAMAQNRWVWLSADIRDAFDQVPRQRLFQALRKRLPSDALIELMTRILDNSQSKGLRQGSSISSLLMLFYLEHFVNKRWCRSQPDVPLIWYMDDILMLTGRQDDAADLYAQLSKTLSDAGVPLKGNYEHAVHQLDRGQQVSWLGFEIARRAEEVQFSIPVTGKGNLLERLQAKLLKVHDRPDAPSRANAVVKGFLKHVGPAFPAMDHPAFCTQVAAAAREAAFEEIPCPTDLTAIWERGYSKWTKVCDEVLDTMSRQDHEGPEGMEWPAEDADLDGAPF